jgi:hypothetical protein
VVYIVLPGKFSPDLALDIVLSGKRNPLPNRSQVAYRPAQEAIQHHTSPSRSCESSPKPGCLAYIVPPGTIYRPLREKLGLSVIVFPGKVKQHITDLSRKNGAKYRPLAQVSSRYRFQIDPRMVRLSADGRSMGFFSGAPRLNNGEYRPLAQGLHDLKAQHTGIPTSRASLKRVEKDQFRSEGAVMGARGGAGPPGAARTGAKSNPTGAETWANSREIPTSRARTRRR